MTVIDNNTGLEWEKKVLGGGICANGDHGVDVFCNWTAATTTWIDAVNAANFAGHNDWRVANVRELMSIVDYNRFSPAIDETIFGPTAAGHHWSSTPAAANPSGAWDVNFRHGRVFTDGKNFSLRVRAVRGGR